MISPRQLSPGSLARSRGGANAEQSLVERINEDPIVLGLGDLDLKRASWRSRQISLLLESPAESVLFVVELQLGPTDDRHVIRIVERWLQAQLSNRFFGAVPVAADDLCQVTDRIRIADPSEFGQDGAPHPALALAGVRDIQPAVDRLCGLLAVRMLQKRRQRPADIPGVLHAGPRRAAVAPEVADHFPHLRVYGRRPAPFRLFDKVCRYYSVTHD